MNFSVFNIKFLSIAGFVNFQKDLKRLISFLFNVGTKLFLQEFISYFSFFFSNQKVEIFYKNKFLNTLWKKHNYYELLCSTQNINKLSHLILVQMYRFNFMNAFNTFEARHYYRAANTFLHLSAQKLTSANTILIGITHFWSKFSLWFIPIILGVTVLYWSMILRVLTFNKVVIVWIILFMVAYWLLSGFVFFFKKYQYGKYTSAIQRFWKRSFMLFWLLETCLLSVFIYLTFVASQESFYMFDQVQIYKTHLFSWRLFFLKIVPLVILLVGCYFLILTLKWNVFSKYSIWLLILTLGLTYVFWLEFYQFYHIVNFYGNLNWLFDVDERVWTLELEPRRTRMVNNYVMWLLMLKFWHLIFVYIFWIFFVLRGWEIKRARYPLLAANFQNLLILYLMSWLTMYVWVKFFFRKFMDLPYSWFYVNNRSMFWRIFYNDIKVYWYGLLQLGLIGGKSSYVTYPFFYWIESIKSSDYVNTQKHFIKVSFLSTI